MGERFAPAFLITFLAAVFALAAAAARADKPPTIGFSAGSMADRSQSIMAELAIIAARKAGLTMLPVADASGNAVRQVAAIRRLMERGATGILAVPTDRDAVAPALDDAAARHVPVVAIDTAPASGTVAMIVRADDRRMAEDACRAIGQRVGGQGVVLSLLDDQGTRDGRERRAGFADCMHANFPAVRVVEEATEGKADRTAPAVRDTLAELPELAAIYVQSDAVMLPGVLGALRRAGRLTSVGAPHHIVLVSIDGTPLALQRIRAGYLDAAVSEPLDLYVTYGLRYLLAAMHGAHFRPGPTDHDSRIVDHKGSLMDLLPAPLVTRANASSPALWGNKIKT